MKTDIKNREYAGTKIPTEARVADKQIKINCIKILKNLYKIKGAKDGHFPNGEMIIPKHYEYRLIPGDLELRDKDDGYQDENIVDSFFNELGKDCFFWNSFGKTDIDIIFLAPYSFNNRIWMMNARFKDNIGITSTDGNFSIVGDIFIRYCIVSGRKDIIRNFDKAWGGVEKIKDDFYQYVNSIPRYDNRLWARKYLIPLLEKYDTY